MDKLFGYTEIKLSNVRLPIKIGTYALEELCKDFDIELYELPSLFTLKDVTQDGKTISVELPKEPTKFLRSILLHGANFVRLVNGEELFKPIDAYEWVSEMGFNTKDAFTVIYLFMGAARTGKSVPSPVDEEPGEKKSL